VHGWGCPPTADADTYFDCAAGASNWERGWSEQKKEWCCRRKSRGCATQIVADAEPHNCMHKAWEEGKAGWCCQNKGRMCLERSFELLRLQLPTGSMPVVAPLFVAGCLGLAATAAVAHSRRHSSHPFVAKASQHGGDSSFSYWPVELEDPEEVAWELE